VANDSQSILRAKAQQLISGGEVDLIVGYGKARLGDGVRPVFVRQPSDAQKLLWNDRCVHNLSTYLLREPCLRLIRKGGRIGIITKGCDARAIVTLIQEKVLRKDSIYVIGVVCSGVRSGDAREGGVPFKCRACEWNIPPLYDDLIGDASGVEPQGGDPLEDIKAIESMPGDERWQFWTTQLSKCIRCYACRQACPLCYCKECITEKSRPQWIEKSPTLKGNIAYHFIRAMHLAGRCISCGECSRACPVEIPVAMLAKVLSLKVKESFDYVPGVDPEAEPFFVTFKDSDPDDFIR
jgi:formate dehydrogenase subunit beta